MATRNPGDSAVDMVNITITYKAFVHPNGGWPLGFLGSIYRDYNKPL